MNYNFLIHRIAKINQIYIQCNFQINFDGKEDNYDYFLGFTGIMDQTPVEDNNVPVRPRTLTTAKCDQLGFLYGSPITSLPAGRKPTKSDVIQLYMHLHDQVN